jgi:hypothetical protein
MNNYDEALKYLEAVQKVDPNNQGVNELIAEIKNKKI